MNLIPGSCTQARNLRAMNNPLPPLENLQVSRLSRLCGEQNTKIGELEEQLGQMIAAGTSKDATLSNLASSRYQMHAELEGK
jgi:hypothetical protein